MDGQGEEPSCRFDYITLVPHLFSVLATSLKSYLVDIANTWPASNSISALQWITGRAVSDLPTSAGCLGMIREWKNQCDNSHRECSSDKTFRLPTRVLNVGTNSETNVRLISDLGREGEYLYLSVMWGETPMQTKNTT